MNTFVVIIMQIEKKMKSMYLSIIPHAKENECKH